jgi:hypothetical protein
MPSSPLFVRAQTSHQAQEAGQSLGHAAQDTTNKAKVRGPGLCAMHATCRPFVFLWLECALCAQRLASSSFNRLQPHPRSTPPASTAPERRRASHRRALRLPRRVWQPAAASWRWQLQLMHAGGRRGCRQAEQPTQVGIGSRRGALVASGPVRRHCSTTASAGLLRASTAPSLAQRLRTRRQPATTFALPAQLLPRPLTHSRCIHSQPLRAAASTRAALLATHSIPPRDPISHHF